MSNALTVTAPEGLPFVMFEREFDADVATVFRAHQDPELAKQWLAPDGYDMVIERYDFVTGGGYRYRHTNNGEEYSFNGVYHVVRENELTIQTFEFEGFPDVVTIETNRFIDLGNGRTRIEGQSTFPSLEARDGMIESGMEVGMTESYVKLDALLPSA
jgi:uncharacterized protein YndB with AHSA1/START domain